MVELNENYHTYDDEPEDRNPRSNLLSRICSCLYLYTFGSCLYFGRTNVSLTRKDRIELRTLWKSRSVTDDASDAQHQEDQWKKKTQKADHLIKKRIQHHFQDHISKWKDTERPRFPWKMMLHILLVIIVTVQVGHAFVATYMCV